MSSPHPLLDAQLSAFLHGGNSMLVATRSASLEPHVTRAAGLRVVSDDQIAVLVPRATSVRTIDNLRDNGDVAVVVCRPRDFATYQLKGRLVEIGDGTRDDVVHCEAQMRAFGTDAARIGNTRAQVRNLWLFDCWRVTVEVRTVYEQTPGPGAGRPRGALDDGG